MPRKRATEQAIEKCLPQQDEIETALESRNLFHHFTEEELAGLNEKVTDLTEKKNAFAEKAKLMGDIAKGSEAEIKHTIGLIKEGGEERALDCPVIINYTQNTYTVKHPETGDVLDQRPLTAKEKQRDLFPQQGEGEPVQEETEQTQSQEAQAQETELCPDEAEPQEGEDDIPY